MSKEQNQQQQAKPAETEAEKTAATPHTGKVVELSVQDMFLMMNQMFKSQAESNEINKKLLQIKEREEEARLAKDADALAKWNRARQAALDELSNFTRNRDNRWKSCKHKDVKQNWTIWPISNFPDGRLRGTCTQCGVPIEPAHYEYDANGKSTLVAEHPLYHVVLERDQDIYAPFLPVMTY